MVTDFIKKQYFVAEMKYKGAYDFVEQWHSIHSIYGLFETNFNNIRTEWDIFLTLMGKITRWNEHDGKHGGENDSPKCDQYVDN